MVKGHFCHKHFIPALNILDQDSDCLLSVGRFTIWDILPWAFGTKTFWHRTFESSGTFPALDILVQNILVEDISDQDRNLGHFLHGHFGPGIGRSIILHILHDSQHEHVLRFIVHLVLFYQAEKFSVQQTRLTCKLSAVSKSTTSFTDALKQLCQCLMDYDMWWSGCDVWESSWAHCRFFHGSYSICWW